MQAVPTLSRKKPGPKHDPLRAQLRSSSGESSKIVKDRQSIEAVVEVLGAGRMVLRVDSAGGYSLRGRPEGDGADGGARRDLLAVGVMRADGFVAVRPEGGPPTQPSTG